MKFPSLPAGALLLFAAFSHAQQTVWDFSSPLDWTSPQAGGSATLDVFDPAAANWFDAGESVKSSTDFGLPPVPGAGGAAKRVLHFPACTAMQGFRVAHPYPANGSYGDAGVLSNYTMIYDVLYPSASDAQWRPLHQTNVTNNEDAEFYIRNTPSGGVGISGNYAGSIPPGVWHRIVIGVAASTGDRWKIQRFVNGTFVGGQNGAADAYRWAMGPEFLLFTEDNSETAEGYVSSIGIVPRLMTMTEIEALGGPDAGGALSPGAPGAAIPNQPRRAAKIIGHRGNSCCAPEDTLVALQQAIAEGAAAMEFDVHLSSDGVVMGMHDPTLERTTPQTGSVNSFTAAQLQSFDAGSWFDPSFSSVRIPTLEQMMNEAKGKIILYLDLKQSGMGPGVKAALDATGFPESDLWLWTYDQSTGAGGDPAALHALMPGATLVFEDASGWQTPGFLAARAAVGVGMFDTGAFSGALNRETVAGVKAAGFKVSAYTLMDPVAIETAINNGVDYFETDFIAAARSIIPVPSLAKATMPFPAQAATNVSAPGFLSWLVGSGATAHRVHFGTQNPPPFVGEQTHDIFSPGALLPGVSYYWRIDEKDSGGTVTTGDVWSFSTAGIPPVPQWEWTFDSDAGAAALGDGLLDWSTANARALASYETTNGTTVPHIGGQPAGYVRLPGYTNPADFPRLTFNGSAPNGGGLYLNQFTVVMDIYMSSPHAWLPLFNTNTNNAAGNDADWYVSPDGALGISALGYSANGAVTADAWHRIIFAADLGAGVVSMYLDGTLVRQRTGASLRDGRFSLFTANDPGPDLILANEGDNSGIYTREWLLSAFAFTSRTLSDADAAQLGGPKAPGIFLTGAVPPVLTISLDATMTHLNWNQSGYLLRRSTDLLNWNPLPGTATATSWSELTTPGRAFFQLVPP
jgi:glycerophosphoryl diester phosphodiesterase